MTAVDAAVQSKLLGAENVTIVYRRGQEKMSAAAMSRTTRCRRGCGSSTMPPRSGCLATARPRRWSSPIRQTGRAGLTLLPETFTLKADQVFKAIGQTLTGAPAGLPVGGWQACRPAGQGLGRRRLCAGGEDLTVTAVAEGRDAAEAIHAAADGRLMAAVFPCLQGLPAPVGAGSGTLHGRLGRKLHRLHRAQPGLVALDHGRLCGGRNHGLPVDPHPLDSGAGRGRRAGRDRGGVVLAALDRGHDRGADRVDLQLLAGLALWRHASCDAPVPEGPSRDGGKGAGRLRQVRAGHHRDRPFHHDLPARGVPDGRDERDDPCPLRLLEHASAASPGRS